MFVSFGSVLTDRNNAASRSQNHTSASEDVTVEYQPTQAIPDTESPDGIESMIQALEREKRDVIWLHEHMGELADRYGVKFVAVRDEEVVGHSERLSDLFQDLERDGVDQRKVTIELLVPHEG